MPDTSDPNRTGRPERHDDYLEALRELHEQGETDACEGGVPSERLAAAMDVEVTVAREHLRTLEERDRVERVRGLDPDTHRPRDSFRPVDTG